MGSGMSRVWKMDFLLLFAMFFNALLAIVNAHVTSVGAGLVMAVEGLVLAGVVVLVYPYKERLMRPWVMFGGFFVLLFIWVLLMNALGGTMPSPKPLRDIFLISAFGMLGMAYQKTGKSPVGVFWWMGMLVSAFIFLENYDTPLYGWLFAIDQYYANTRGIVATNLYSQEGLGLFVNTQLLEGRFTLGFLTTHRLASLFLEQTSLGNFAVVMAMAASVFWEDMRRRDKVLFVGFTVLAILATDSRLALGGALIALGGHIVFPRVPRWAQLWIMPVFLVVSALIFYDPGLRTLEADNLPGRFAWSLYQIAHIDLWGYLGGRPEMISASMDSGYSYMIYAQSLVGMLVFWFFTAGILRGDDVASRRLGPMVALYVAINLMTGPTLLSIKMAAPLWFLVGYVYRASLVRPIA